MSHRTPKRAERDGFCVKTDKQAHYRVYREWLKTALPKALQALPAIGAEPGRMSNGTSRTEDN